jgi:hypothetical protein
MDDAFLLTPEHIEKVRRGAPHKSSGKPTTSLLFKIALISYFLKLQLTAPVSFVS